jgi:hypothetical protein
MLHQHRNRTVYSHLDCPSNPNNLEYTGCSPFRSRTFCMYILRSPCYSPDCLLSLEYCKYTLRKITQTIYYVEHDNTDKWEKYINKYTYILINIVIALQYFTRLHTCGTFIIVGKTCSYMRTLTPIWV